MLPQHSILHDPFAWKNSRCSNNCGTHCIINTCTTTFSMFFFNIFFNTRRILTAIQSKRDILKSWTFWDLTRLFFSTWQTQCDLKPLKFPFMKRHFPPKCDSWVNSSQAEAVFEVILAVFWNAFQKWCFPVANGSFFSVRTFFWGLLGEAVFALYHKFLVFNGYCDKIS